MKSLDVAIRERDRVVQELNELRGTLTKRKVNKRSVERTPQLTRPITQSRRVVDGGERRIGDWARLETRVSIWCHIYYITGR